MEQVTIVKLLKRSVATIGREIKHNTGKLGYRPKQANDLATARRLNASKHIKLTPVPELCRGYGMSNTTFYKWCAKYGGINDH
jgi:IS30 family transposase